MRKKHIAWQWLSAVVISILMFSAPAFAGNLNPSAPPAPTMKTLDQAPAKDEVIPPWSQTLPASERFKLVLGGAGVLDRETGIVWEQSPSTAYISWYNAQTTCMIKTVGGRRGWRVPSIQELLSLYDPACGCYPYYPWPHPFDIYSMGTHVYWSATTNAELTVHAWTLSFSSGNVFGRDKGDTSYAHVWCVRGGSGSDTQ